MPLIPTYRKFTLDNGVNVVVESHDHVRGVSVGVWVKVGSSLESKIENGFSHFVEHMVFKGTERRSQIEIVTALESLGGDLNAFTDREFTCYHATFLKEHIDVALDVLSDLILRPTFPDKEFEREKRILLQEMAESEEDPVDRIFDQLFQTVWNRQPLGQPILGRKGNLRNFTRNRIQKFYEQHYRSDNIIVSIAGNVNVDDVKIKCEKYFSFKSPIQRVFPIVSTPSRFTSKKKFINASGLDQMHLVLGYEGGGFKDPLRFETLLLSFFLGGGMSSRLFQEIREKAGLAYSIDCDFIPYTEAGLFTIYLATTSKSLLKCLDIIQGQVEKLKSETLKESELELVKGQLLGSILLSSDYVETRQESLGRNEIVFGRYFSVDEVISEIRKVTCESINSLAKKLFVREKEGVLLMGNKQMNMSNIGAVI